MSAHETSPHEDVPALDPLIAEALHHLPPSPPPPAREMALCGLDARTTKLPRVPLRPALAAAAVLCALAATWWALRSSRDPQARPEAVGPAPIAWYAPQRDAWQIRDGQHVAQAPTEATLALARLVRLVARPGAAVQALSRSQMRVGGAALWFAVTPPDHLPAPALDVLVAGHRIEVVGTQFVVTPPHAEAPLRVAVHTGALRVDGRPVAAGEVWSGGVISTGKRGAHVRPSWWPVPVAALQLAPPATGTASRDPSVQRLRLVLRNPHAMDLALGPLESPILLEWFDEGRESLRTLLVRSEHLGEGDHGWLRGRPLRLRANTRWSLNLRLKRAGAPRAAYGLRALLRPRDHAPLLTADWVLPAASEPK